MKVTTYKVDKRFLRETPVPNETRTYKPVEHEQLIDLVLNGINNAGFKLRDENYTAARDGQIANGRYSISSVADNEMCLELGWQNSYNKQLTLKFSIGTRIFICDNGSVRGDFGWFKKKHMGNVQEFTPTAITEYIQRAADTFALMQKDREAMKQVEVSDRVKAELVGRMMIEEEFITSSQLSTIARNIKKPDYDYNCPNSMWELYQFTTQALRECHPALWMETHIKAHNFFVRESGLVVPEAKIIVPTPGTHPQIDLFSVEVEEKMDAVLANTNE